jgi:multisubunit Na+/H+ antiporter MnhB subunit
MTTFNPNEEKREILQPLTTTTMTSINKKRRTKNILMIIGVVVAIGLYILFSYWHPFWRYQSGYVSEVQFGADWPFTVSEARLVCLGAYDMILETRVGVFGLTGNALRIGYKSLEDSTIWKWDPNGWNHRVPADKFWLYVNTLCK